MSTQETHRREFTNLNLVCHDAHRDQGQAGQETGLVESDELHGGKALKNNRPEKRKKKKQNERREPMMDAECDSV